MTKKNYVVTKKNKKNLEGDKKIVEDFHPIFFWHFIYSKLLVESEVASGDYVGSEVVLINGDPSLHL